LVGSTPTSVVLVVTSTPDPSLPTQTPIVITATQEELPTQQSQIIVPTSTEPIIETEEPTAEVEAGTEEANAVAATDLPTGNDTRDLGAEDGALAPQLEAIAALSPLVPIDGGSFLMGTLDTEVAPSVRFCVDSGGACLSSDADDSIPQHEVVLDPYQIEANEVTYGQYIAFLTYLKSTGVDHRNGCTYNGLAQQCVVTTMEDATISSIGYDSANYTIPSFIEELPVINVTWFGANAYCEAINRRLPTEAEWERAARGRSNSLFPWGNPPEAFEVDNTQVVTGIFGGAVSAPVAVNTVNRDTNDFGVLHMGGNVSEWVADWYSATTYNQNSQQGVVNNPTGPARGEYRVVRGGNYAYNLFFARAVHRLNRRPGEDFANVGFRCADDAVEEPASTINDTGANTTTQGTTDTQAGFTPAAGTPDPASLGVIDSATEESSAPTLPAAPTSAVTTPIPSLPPGD
jgi:formylglycine-generating enzyme required for sulfatase activity